MSREALQESLSALMDNETDELELRRVLAASGEGEVRATWARYQVARAVMHKELLEPRLDLAAAVSAALADEPALASSKPRLPWRGLGRLAVAASVTVAVLAGVRVYNQDDLAATLHAAGIVPDPARIYSERRRMAAALARHLGPRLPALVAEMAEPGPFSPDARAAGRRRRSRGPASWRSVPRPCVAVARRS